MVKQSFRRRRPDAKKAARCWARWRRRRGCAQRHAQVDLEEEGRAWKRFLQAHATHPDWRFALAMVQPQLEATPGAGRAARLRAHAGWLYLTDHYASEAEALLAELQRAINRRGLAQRVMPPAASSTPDEPALSVMLAELSICRSPRLPAPGRSALSAVLPRIPRRCMPTRPRPIWPSWWSTWPGAPPPATCSAVRRGAHAHRGTSPTACCRAACRASPSSEVALVSRVTQGCQPVGRTRRISAFDRQRGDGARRRAGARPLVVDLGAAGASRARAAAAAPDAGRPDRPHWSAATAAAAQRGARPRHARAPPRRVDPARRGGRQRPAPEGLELAFCQRLRRGGVARPRGASAPRSVGEPAPEELPLFGHVAACRRRRRGARIASPAPCT